MKKTVPGLSFWDRCLYWLWRRNRRFQRRAELVANRRIMLRLGACGQGVYFGGRMVIHSPKNVMIGNNVHIGDNAWIQGEGGLTIGDNCHISRNLTLYTANHRYQGDRIPYDEHLVKKPVVIGRNVWIGMNVCIVPGATIGDGAIIGMGAVVSGEVAPCCIVGSQQLRILGYRDREQYDKLDKNREYGGSGGRPFHANA